MNTEDLSTMTTDTLLEMREVWRTEGKRLLDLASQAEFEILRRLQEDGATRYDSLQWAGPIEPGKKTYSFTLPVLATLQPLLLPGEWEQLVTERTTQEVNKVMLNKLERRGGEIARIVAEATTTFEGQPRLAIKRIGGQDA